jgi:hypothetical protein
LRAFIGSKEVFRLNRGPNMLGLKKMTKKGHGLGFSCAKVEVDSHGLDGRFLPGVITVLVFGNAAGRCQGWVYKAWG